MEDPDRIRKEFSAYRFSTPAPLAEIEAAELKLGHSLPALLKQHYSAYDGFLGPTHAQFLYPLSKLVETTLFLRSDDFPSFLHLAVAVGDYGIGSYWLIRIDAPDSILEWDAEWGDDFENLGGSLTDVWIAEKERYESEDIA